MRSDKQSSLASKAGLGFRGPTTAVSSNTREILKGMQDEDYANEGSHQISICVRNRT